MAAQTPPASLSKIAVCPSSARASLSKRAEYVAGTIRERQADQRAAGVNVRIPYDSPEALWVEGRAPRQSQLNNTCGQHGDRVSAGYRDLRRMRWRPGWDQGSLTDASPHFTRSRRKSAALCYPDGAHTPTPAHPPAPHSAAAVPDNRRIMTTR